MTKILLKGLILFLVIMIASKLMIDMFGTKFGEVDFFLRHGWFFLFFVTFFPRLTLIFSSVPFGGFFWWLGLIFCPRILVATLATVTYFKTNPVLVVIAWMVALSGEAFEKLSLNKRPRFAFRFVNLKAHQKKQTKQKEDLDQGTFEAEYTRKD